MVPELNEGAEGEDDVPEFETDVLAKDALQLGHTLPPSERHGRALLWRRRPGRGGMRALVTRLPGRRCQPCQTPA